MILQDDAPLGKELAEALGLRDTILDLSVTPNRPDWLSVIGVAREIAALSRSLRKIARTEKRTKPMRSAVWTIIFYNPHERITN
jgi:phenylalanyl-tRNA synthetase beta subunit